MPPLPFRVFSLKMQNEQLTLRVKRATHKSPQATFQLEIPAALLPVKKVDSPAAFVCVDYKESCERYYHAPHWLERYKVQHFEVIEGRSDAEIRRENKEAKRFRMHDESLFESMDPTQGVLGSRGADECVRLSARKLVIECANENEAGTLTAAQPLRARLYLLWKLPILDRPERGEIGGVGVASLCLDFRSV